MLHIDAGADLDAELFEVFEFLRDNARTRTVLGEDVARNAVAAFLTNRILVVFDAEFLHCPFVVGERGVGDELHLFGLIQIEAGNEHVVREELGRILNAVLKLLRAAGRRQNAAVDDGVAAGHGHLFEDLDLGARLLRFNGGGKTRKARTDDEHFGGFVPLLGERNSAGGVSRFRAEERSGAHRDGTLEKRTTIHFSHFSFSPLKRSVVLFVGQLLIFVSGGCPRDLHHAFNFL